MSNLQIRTALNTDLMIAFADASKDKFTGVLCFIDKKSPFNLNGIAHTFRTFTYEEGTCVETGKPTSIRHGADFKCFSGVRRAK